MAAEPYLLKAPVVVIVVIVKVEAISSVIVKIEYDVLLKNTRKMICKSRSGTSNLFNRKKEY